MIHRTVVKWLGCAVMIMLLAACGGGETATQTQPTSATLKLATRGTLPAGTTLSGVFITVTLPAGVSVMTDAAGAVAAGVVAVSGVAVPGNFLPPAYTPASGAAPASLRIALSSTAAAGFGVGEFATVICNIASGSHPQASDFSLSGFSAIDLSGNTVGVLTTSFVADIR